MTKIRSSPRSLRSQRLRVEVVIPSSRGFIVVVVVGLLAILLTVGVGFISYTRSEVQAVAHIRDKVDVSDVAHSATDWIIANISRALFDANDLVRDDAFISN